MLLNEYQSGRDDIQRLQKGEQIYEMNMLFPDIVIFIMNEIKKCKKSNFAVLLELFIVLLFSKESFISTKMRIQLIAHEIVC